MIRKPYKVYETKTTASISSVPAPAPTQQPARAADTTLNYSMMDHKKVIPQPSSSRQSAVSAPNIQFAFVQFPQL